MVHSQKKGQKKGTAKRDGRPGEREGKSNSLNQESTRLRKFRIQTEEEKDPVI